MRRSEGLCTNGVPHIKDWSLSILKMGLLKGRRGPYIALDTPCFVFSSEMTHFEQYCSYIVIERSVIPP
jgi:hypothetical protein